MFRKDKATLENMKITHFHAENMSKFKIRVMGNRNISYDIDFEENRTKCSCPDFIYKKSDSKIICKHLFFIVHLINYPVFYSVLNVNDLRVLQDIENIRMIYARMLDVIEYRKQIADGKNGGVTIERDESCPICMDELNQSIEKCSKCMHCMHYECLIGWWYVPSNTNERKGKCPYCRDAHGFSHIFQNTCPWESFDFNGVVVSATGVATGVASGVATGVATGVADDSTSTIAVNRAGTCACTICIH